MGHHGYTCGLWRLFHTLALTALKVNETEGATEAISGYVESFFACKECNKHFRAVVSSTANRDDVFVVGSKTADGDLLLCRALCYANLS